MTVDAKQEEDLPDEGMKNELLFGVKNIADFLGESQRRVQHLIDTKKLPTGRLGRRVITTKSKLRDHILRSIA